MQNDGKKRGQNAQAILRKAEARLNKLHATDKEMSPAISVIEIAFFFFKRGSKKAKKTGDYEYIE